MSTPGSQWIPGSFGEPLYATLADPAMTVPRMTAMLVIMLIEPFARLRSFSSTNSGIIPYLAGPKNELWQVSATRAKSVVYRFSK